MHSPRHHIHSFCAPIFVQYSLESLSQCGYTLKSVSLDLHADDIADNIVTEYESRFVAQGLPIYRVEATV